MGGKEALVAGAGLAAAPGSISAASAGGSRVTLAGSVAAAGKACAAPAGACSACAATEGCRVAMIVSTTTALRGGSKVGSKGVGGALAAPSKLWLTDS
eukprot:2084195-Alexandrium_andersonii.AAC.1